MKKNYKERNLSDLIDLHIEGIASLLSKPYYCGRIRLISEIRRILDYIEEVLNDIYYDHFDEITPDYISKILERVSKLKVGNEEFNKDCDDIAIFISKALDDE